MEHGTTYKIAVKFEDNPKADYLVNFMERNVKNVKKSIVDNITEIELNVNNFCIEILIVDIEKAIKMTRESPDIKINTKMYIYLAKSNNPEIIDEVLKFLFEINTKLKISGILDIEAGVLINLKNYEDLKNRFRVKSEIFNNRYPNAYNYLKYKELEQFISSLAKD